MNNEKILIIAPHPDDETLALGGTIAKFIPNNEIYILVIGGHLPPLYTYNEYDQTENEAKEAFQILGVSKYKFLKIPATKIIDLPISNLNQKIMDTINYFEPTIIFSPFPDRHVDHKLIFESCMVCSRPLGIAKKIKLIAVYETLSETHWNAPYIEPNFVPNFTIDISDFIKKKLDALSSYKSQISSSDGPRSLRAVEALAKFRGSQSGFNYGEGFHIIRMTD